MKRILLIFLIAGAGLRAQTPSGPWTLEAALEHAVENNLVVQNAAIDAAQAQAQLQQAQLNLLPSVNAGIDNTWRFGRSIDQFTNTFVEQQIRNNNLFVRADVTLFNGFANRNSIKVQERSLRAGQADTEAAENDTKLSVAASYLNILLARELLARADTQLVSSREQAARTEKLVRAGAAPEASLLDLQSQQATDELQVINARNLLQLAKLQLQQLLQLPVSDDFEVVIPDLDGLLGDEPVVLTSPERVYKEALLTQPQIRAADLRVESSLLNVQTTKSRLYPRLDLTANAFTGYSSGRT
ncbi:MAG: TolC family protein, partial [Catalinimonas sp.]